MKAVLKALVGATICISAPVAAEQLTIEQIQQLASAGIGDEAIIAKIKSSGTHYDLTADQMIALKSAGISGAVMAAIISSGEPPAPKLSMDSPDPMAPHPSGVYLVTEDGGSKMLRIDATVSNQAKTGGIFGYALTGGLASMSVKAAIQNQSARTKTHSGQPTFYFFFDESNGDVAPTSSWSAGDAAKVTSPAEFTLIRLMVKDGRREARVGSANIAGAKTGVMDKDRIPFDYQMVRPGVYRVIPTAALTRGEYGFIYALQGGGGRGGMMTARVFDFTVL